MSIGIVCTRYFLHFDLRQICEGVASRFGCKFPFSHIGSTSMLNPQRYYPDFLGRNIGADKKGRLYYCCSFDPGLEYLQPAPPAPGRCVNIIAFPVTPDRKKGLGLGTTLVFTEDGIRQLHTYPPNKLRIV